LCVLRSYRVRCLRLHGGAQQQKLREKLGARVKAKAGGGTAAAGVLASGATGGAGAGGAQTTTGLGSLGSGRGENSLDSLGIRAELYKEISECFITLLVR
jgi:hypothetical protein